MAGILPSFLNGSMITIRVGSSRIAYCQNLRFSRSIPHAPITGVGSYSVHALEPVDYMAQGSMQILRYTSAAVFGSTVSGQDGMGGAVPGRVTGALGSTLPDNMFVVTEDKNRNGNSMIDHLSFNPAKLLLSYTFDIEVFERFSGDDTGTLCYQFRDCRLTNYSFNFAPGELLIENVDFVCRNIIDRIANPNGSSEELDTKVSLL